MVLSDTENSNRLQKEEDNDDMELWYSVDMVGNVKEKEEEDDEWREKMMRDGDFSRQNVGANCALFALVLAGVLGFVVVALQRQTRFKSKTLALMVWCCEIDWVDRRLIF